MKRAENKPKPSNKDVGFEKYKAQGSLNLPPDTPESRLNVQKLPRNNPPLFSPKERSAFEKCLRFLNPNDDMILKLHSAVRTGGNLPAWAEFMKDALRVQKNTLFLDEKPLYLKQRRHLAVKRTYFNPSFGVSQAAVYDHLDTKIANITRKFVRDSLKRLEHYQRIFPRRLPQNINTKFTYKKPGIISCDCFFPSLQNGWLGKRTVLVVADCWSRYTKIYVMTNRAKELVNERVIDFFRQFLKFGHTPRRILCDKGGEFAGLPSVMERFRKRGEKGPLVLHSQAGTPVNYIESLNSQVQRMMQVCKKLTSKPEEVCHLIASAINKQKRKRKGNLTPIEMLRLNQREVARLNREYPIPDVNGVPNLPDLQVGDRCRYLLLTRKEQISSLDSDKKGFAIKWSKTLHTVTKKIRLRKNRDVFNFYLHPAAPNNKPRYRHELLKIPHGHIDTEIPQMKPGSLKSKLYT